MRIKDSGHMDFLLEMSERQISAREFFSNVLLDSMDRNFGLKNVLILCFDTENHFLSWTDSSGIRLAGEEHPYCRFKEQDVINHKIYRDAVRDHLDYFNTEPRLYKSTQIIGAADYEQSPYVQFLEENFKAHYSVTMAFGINAYIQIIFFKSLEEGDFTEDELDSLHKIYIYVANSYKNFKKHEHTKIISNIRDEMISSGESAYLVTDDFMHIMSYNQEALEYLKVLLGPFIEEQMRSQQPCTWLPFLLEGGEVNAGADYVQTRVIKNLVFKIYTYDQGYSHGIVDRYHWITISEKGEEAPQMPMVERPKLTHAEQKVVDLLCQGLTYQSIANELVVSYHTVKNHVQNIYTKCGVKSRFQLYELFKKDNRK